MALYEPELPHYAIEREGDSHDRMVGARPMNLLDGELPLVRHPTWPGWFVTPAEAQALGGQAALKPEDEEEEEAAAPSPPRRLADLLPEQTDEVKLAQTGFAGEFFQA